MYICLFFVVVLLWQHHTSCTDFVSTGRLDVVATTFKSQWPTLSRVYFLLVIHVHHELPTFLLHIFHPLGFLQLLLGGFLLLWQIVGK